jgi:glutaredoxin
MKITIYTITDCAFSKQEKEYLSSHGLQFEEKNLETNREFLTEMLAVGSNFAGTPVTKIEKDDGQSIVLKGFTASEFDKALALAPAAPAAEPAKAVEPAAQTETAAATPAVEEPPVAPTAPTPTEAPVAPTPTPPAVTTTTDPAMASVLNTLEQQVAAMPKEAPTSAQATVGKPADAVTPTTPPVPGTPSIPDPQF